MIPWLIIFAGYATGVVVAMLIMGFDGWLFGVGLISASLALFSLWYERRELRRHAESAKRFDAACAAALKRATRWKELQ